MKRSIILLMIIALLFIFAQSAAAGNMDVLYEAADPDAKTVIEKDDLEDARSIIEHLSPENLLTFIKNSVIASIPSVKRLAAALVTVIGVSFIVSALVSGKSKDLADLCVCVFAICVLHNAVYPLICGAFIKLLSQNAFLSLLFSFMSAGMAAAGKTVSAGLMPVSAMGIVVLMSNAVSVFFIPLGEIMLCLSYSAAIENGILQRAVTMARNAAVWLITLAGIVFSGVTAIQKCVAAAGDSIATSAARFIISGSMPIIGSTVKDAFSTVLSSSKMIVASAGAFGIISICIALFPQLIRLLMTLFVLQMANACLSASDLPSVKILIKSITSIFEIITAIYACETMYIIFSAGIMMSVV